MARGVRWGKVASRKGDGGYDTSPSTPTENHCIIASPLFGCTSLSDLTVTRPLSFLRVALDGSTVGITGPGSVQELLDLCRLTAGMAPQFA